MTPHHEFRRKQRKRQRCWTRSPNHVKLLWWRCWFFSSQKRPTVKRLSNNNISSMKISARLVEVALASFAKAVESNLTLRPQKEQEALIPQRKVYIHAYWTWIISHLESFPNSLLFLLYFWSTQICVLRHKDRYVVKTVLSAVWQRGRRNYFYATTTRKENFTRPFVSPKMVLLVISRITMMIIAANALKTSLFAS